MACSIVRTPAFAALMIELRDSAWQATGLPLSSASSQTARSSLKDIVSRCAGQSGLKPVPLASTFTQSTPSFTCWRTALRACHGPVTISVSAAAYCSRRKMWVGCMSPRPPQTEMICFEAFTRGPGSRPSRDRVADDHRDVAAGADVPDRREPHALQQRGVQRGVDRGRSSGFDELDRCRGPAPPT